MFRLTSLKNQKDERDKRIRLQSEGYSETGKSPRTPKDNIPDGAADNHFDYLGEMFRTSSVRVRVLENLIFFPCC